MDKTVQSSTFKFFVFDFKVFVLLTNETGVDLADLLQIFTPHVAEIHIEIEIHVSKATGRNGCPCLT